MILSVSLKSISAFRLTNNDSIVYIIRLQSIISLAKHLYAQCKHKQFLHKHTDKYISLILLSRKFRSQRYRFYPELLGIQ